MADFYPEKFPELKRENPLFQAEGKVYDAFQKELKGEWNLFYNVNWIGKRRPERGNEDGEIDFLLAHPEKGILVIEVKGGGIEYDARSRNWHSIDRNSIKNPIKDPFQQAKENKYYLIQKLKEAAFFAQKKFLVGTAVFFPSISSFSGSSEASHPSQCVLTSSDIGKLEQKLLEILKYWKADDSTLELPGRDCIQRLQSLFGKSFSVKPALGAYVEEVRNKAMELTEEQYELLENLEKVKKMSISGGAGTGKTMLALEKAVRLAKDGQNTLFVCYNENLAKYIRDSAGKIKNLTVSTFHSLCRLYDRMALDALPGTVLEYNAYDENYFNNILPDRLLGALEKVNNRFNAVIVDEGQDFRKNWWVPLELLLSHSEDGLFYVFYDEYQKLYDVEMHLSFQGKMMHYHLRRNLRNTKEIFGLARRFDRGKTESHRSALNGDPVEFVECRDAQFLRDELKRRIQKMIVNERISKERIAILSLDKRQSHLGLGETDALGPFRLSSDLNEWGNAVFYDSVRRFKGLEADIVFLIDIPNRKDLLSQTDLLYVGITRGRSVLTFLGSKESLDFLRGGTDV